MTESKTTVRVARKSHYCNACNRRAIKPGDRYLRYVLFPSHEMASGTFRAGRECADCAQRYGRGHLLTAVEVTA